MSEAKHTPGPWKAHVTNLARSGQTEYEIHWSEDGECVAEIVHGAPDAHLIAAAPEMLEALKHAAQNMPHPDQMIDDAIAKAEGRS
ncbi:hypothetical protein [Thalassospira povalilytica]|uniref:hypothetical protein n=1 Tax=Thalassospira povalilytica TaxID=732237 RepID=UPI001D18BC00|nr:hypothetical protein [Thalassospira povalilytica]MCC4240345.1 hypothetical protein [Thalassospira povalilytica]